ncbi:hypothetical protein THAR02_04025 [Trichoderma harzianum]|uniref:Chromatin modification-related protein EAF3 n=1 Tax=Trichoderma harzianum TaxID=5544 RepID=A0A0F9XFH7_TRIHA|nr:hypothetical protein THAR02_04025 [Trichoderma harzianum]
MAPARQQPPPPFGKDEKVLCFHMDMLYEAKIMDVQPAEKPNEGYRYKVHYKGWKNTWDDWVLVDRIRPFDDEHKELAVQLHAQLKNSMQKTSKVPKKIVKSGGESARGSEERGSAVTQGGRGGRRGKDWELEQQYDRQDANGEKRNPLAAFPLRAHPQANPEKKIGFIIGCREAVRANPKVQPDHLDTKQQPAHLDTKRQPDHLDMERQANLSYEEDAFHSKPMINISVPDHIQAMLVDDWENITKNNQLVPLPHPNPVTKIFEDYLAVERPRREEGSSSMDILEEVIAGFREYFEKALSRILLYRFERHQYMDVRKLWDNADENSQYKNVCDVYGAEHLARLIVSLPELLAQTNMDQQSVSRLREEIGKFTTWLGRNCQSYFVNEYETPSQEYIDKARSF